MKNIFVVTHTESQHHVDGKVGGWYDTGLTPKGVEQAKRVARSLREKVEDPDPHITASDLQRTMQTAAIIGQAFHRQVQSNADLREMSQGTAEGQAQAWLDARMSVAPDDNRLDHQAIAGGETKRQFVSRVYRGLDVVLANPAATQIVVTHGFALTFVVARWIGMPVEAAGFVNFRATPGGITHLRQDDFWRNREVRSLNDTSHLG